MNERPPRPVSGSEGFEYVAIADPSWRIDVGRACRAGAGMGHQACGRPSVAVIRRGTYKAQWWAYCERHLFGRWIENGQVMYWKRSKIGGDQS